MILRGDGDGKGGMGGPTLDELFRRAAVTNPDALALIDPPNRAMVTGGAPRQLTYAQADRAISVLAARFCRLGLQADTIVAIQLPNTVENIITLLAVLRAGMIAVPLPLLWRRHDMTAALRHLGAKVIVTASRVGLFDHADLAMQVAAELFPIRFVCAYGARLPDGVMPLDDIFEAQQSQIVPRTMRGGQAADHVAAVTFDVSASGLVPVARHHGQLIAGGHALAADGITGARLDILSAIPPSSFAGLAATLLPWLVGGGTLSLHQGFDRDVFGAQCREHTGGIVVLPGPAVMPLAEAGHLSAAATIVAIWRSPEQLTSATAWRGSARVMDISCFGEVGLIAMPRGEDGLPAELPHDASAEATRGKTGSLMLRGPMVPTRDFPPGGDAKAPHLAVDSDGFVDTGFTCRADASLQRLTVTGPPGGMAVIGGYRLSGRDIETQVSMADPMATIVALPGGLLAQRLAGSAMDNGAVAADLIRRGANPLLAGAFRPRGRAA